MHAVFSLPGRLIIYLPPSPPQPLVDVSIKGGKKISNGSIPNPQWLIIWKISHCTYIRCFRLILYKRRCMTYGIWNVSGIQLAVTFCRTTSCCQWFGVMKLRMPGKIFRHEFPILSQFMTFFVLFCRRLQIILLWCDFTWWGSISQAVMHEYFCFFGTDVLFTKLILSVDINRQWR